MVKCWETCRYHAGSNGKKENKFDDPYLVRRYSCSNPYIMREGIFAIKKSGPQETDLPFRLAVVHQVSPCEIPLTRVQIDKIELERDQALAYCTLCQYYEAKKDYSQ